MSGQDGSMSGLVPPPNGRPRRTETHFRNKENASGYPDNLEITPRMRKGTVLNRSNFGCLGGIPTLNITNGCLFSCAYCYARGYSQAPRGKEVQVYVNLPELLEKELPRKRQVPPWVIINTASDCFQPHPDILRVAFETMRILLDWGVGVSILTKGEIPGKFLDLFRRNPGKVLAQVGLVSLSERYWRDYEPYAAHPEVRIRNLFHLRDLGISPEVRMDPIIPFVTDTENEIAELLERVKDAGVQRVSLSYLHLRPPIRDQLIRELSPLHRKLLEACFHGGDWTVVGSSTMTKLLPPLLREKGYDRIRGIAKKVGVRAIVCRCKNPDLEGDLCGSARGQTRGAERSTAQLPLFRC